VESQVLHRISLYPGYQFLGLPDLATHPQKFRLPVIPFLPATRDYPEAGLVSDGLTGVAGSVSVPADGTEPPLPAVSSGFASKDSLGIGLMSVGEGAGTVPGETPSAAPPELVRSPEEPRLVFDRAPDKLLGLRLSGCSRICPDCSRMPW
jgi:hypothetical protein